MMQKPECRVVKSRKIHRAGGAIFAPPDLNQIQNIIHSFTARVAIKVGIFSSCSRPSPLVSS